MIALKIGNVEIPTRAGIDLEQTYTPIGGETILRTLNGTGIKQSTWAKLRTTISGGGWSPTGLSLLDTTVPQSIACIMPRAVIADANRQATLPAARRGDSGALPGLGLCCPAVTRSIRQLPWPVMSLPPVPFPARSATRFFTCRCLTVGSVGQQNPDRAVMRAIVGRSNARRFDPFF